MDYSKYEIRISIIELSDVGMSMVNSVTAFNQPMYLHGNSCRHYTSSLPAQAGSYSTWFPARFASLKTLLLCPRCVTTHAAVAYSISSRVNPQISSYYFRIGPYLIPNKPVTLINQTQMGGYAEAYMEVLRTFHALSHADIGTSIAFDQYNIHNSHLVVLSKHNDAIIYLLLVHY